MLLVATIAILVGGSAWYMVLSHLWFFSMVVVILSLTAYDMEQTMNNTFLKRAYKKMPATECCAMSEHFKYPKYVLRTTIALRTFAGMCAAVAVVITSYGRHDFATGHYYMVSGSWVFVTVVWVVSCIPMIVSLLQCAAMSDDAIVIEYRKRISVWIIHDVFLGLFWLYLAVMLYDLSDDNDDSEWRTIFLSMISWHLIILVLGEIYMTETSVSSKSCCGPGNSQAWLRFFLLMAFVGIYCVVIWRMQDNNLTKLGMSPWSFVLFLVSVITAYLCKSHIQDDPLLDEKWNSADSTKNKNTLEGRWTPYKSLGNRLYF